MSRVERLADRFALAPRRSPNLARELVRHLRVSISLAYTKEEKLVAFARVIPPHSEGLPHESLIRLRAK